MSAKGIFLFCIFVVLISSFNGIHAVEDEEAEGGYNQTQGKRVLIAVQKSEFKDAVAKSVVDSVQKMDIKADIINLKNLQVKTASDYNAIVILNTVRAWQLNSKARKFLKKIEPQARGKVILISTAAGEDWLTKEKGVHAVTSASKIEKLGEVSEFIIENLMEILGLGY